MFAATHPRFSVVEKVKKLVESWTGTHLEYHHLGVRRADVARAQAGGPDGPTALFLIPRLRDFIGAAYLSECRGESITNSDNRGAGSATSEERLSGPARGR